MEQLARRDKERSQETVIIQPEGEEIVARLTLKHHDPEETIPGQQYRKVVFGKVVLRIGKKDSCFTTTRGDVVVLSNIVQRNRRVILVGKRFNCLEDYYTYPVPSSELGIYRVSRLVEERGRYRLQDIESKCWLIPDGDFFVCVPLGHTV